MKWDPENKTISCLGKDLLYSAFIASWTKVCFKLKVPLNYKREGIFGEWLRSLEVPEEDIVNMSMMAKSISLDLIDSAEEFIKTEGLQFIR